MNMSHPVRFINGKLITWTEKCVGYILRSIFLLQNKNLPTVSTVFFTFNFFIVEYSTNVPIFFLLRSENMYCLVKIPQLAYKPYRCTEKLYIVAKNGVFPPLD